MSSSTGRPAASAPKGKTKGERQAAAIVEAVRQLAGEKPMSAITISEITTRAGITRPVFYFYFDSKYSPLAVALRDAVEQLRDSVDTATEPCDSVDELMYQVVTAGAAANVEHFPVLRAALESRAQDQEIAAMVETTVALLTSRAVELITELADRYPPASPENLEATIRVLVGMTILAGQNMDLVAPDQSTDALQSIMQIWRNAIWH